MNVVLDTSVFVSSLLNKQGVPAQVIDAWRAHLFQLVTSPAIVEEIRLTMASSRMRRRYHVPDEDIEQLLDEAVFLRDGQIMLHKSVDAIREEDGKSVDDLFREVFKC